MIKFLIKISQRLSTENKVINNLLNALGEIVLLVIEILVALEIINWNDLRKNEIWITDKIA